MIANCKIKLAEFRDKFEVLSLFMKPFEGVLLSSFIRMLPLVDLHHFSDHISFSLVARLCFKADGLISRGQWR